MTAILLNDEVGSPARHMSVLRARCIARYRLKSVPGRPEELEQVGTGKIISFGYIHGSVRIRQHGGPTNRQWVDHRDITFKDGWLSEVYDYLDSFFHYATPVHAFGKTGTTTIR